MRHLVCGNEEVILRDASGSSSTRTVRLREFRNGEDNLGFLIEKKISKNERFCSFEVFPAARAKGEDNRYHERLFEELEECSPLFYTITWHAETTVENHPSLRLLEKSPNNTLLHIAAKGLKCEDVVTILNRTLSLGKRNIFALQGDNSSEGGDFPYAKNLVQFVRAQFGSKFCICVAGYPQMHPKSSSKEFDLHYLKEKVEAGADFIITQLIFDSRIFLNFVKDCRKTGIAVPIIPGIFPFPNYGALTRMTEICKVHVPENIVNDLRTVKDNDEAVANYGVELAVRIIGDIFKDGSANGFHLFTLNRSSLATEVCRRVGICQPTISGLS